MGLCFGGTGDLTDRRRDNLSSWSILNLLKDRDRGVGCDRVSGRALFISPGYEKENTRASVRVVSGHAIFCTFTRCFK